jgi:hypothetical protein
MKKTTLAFLISILAFFLRISIAYNGPIEYDEPIYATAAAQYNLAMRQGNWNQILDSTYHIEHPQFYELVYAVGLMAGKSVPDTSLILAGKDLTSVGFWPKLLILRMISVILGTATVFLVSLIYPPAGLFLAINTYAIHYTSVIYLEALPAFTSLVALISALRSLKAYQESPQNSKRWLGWLVLSSLSLGITAASKYIYCLVGIGIIIAILIQGRRKIVASLLGLAGWGLLALAFFFVFNPVLWNSPLSKLVNSWTMQLIYAASYHVEVGYPSWQPIKWLMIAIPQQPNIPVAFFINKGDFFISIDSLIFVLALLGLPVLFQKNRPIFIWLVIGLAFLLLWTTKWPQYIMAIMVPFCVSAAHGFDFLLTKLIKKQFQIR